MAQQITTNIQLLEELTRLRQLLSQATLSQGNHQYQNVTADGYSQVLLGDVHHHHYHQLHQQSLHEIVTGGSDVSSISRQHPSQNEPRQKDCGTIARTEACLRRLYNLPTDGEDTSISPRQTRAAINDLVTLLREISSSEPSLPNGLPHKGLVDNDLDRVTSVVQLTREIRKERHEDPPKRHIGEYWQTTKGENQGHIGSSNPNGFHPPLKTRRTSLFSGPINGLRKRRVCGPRGVLVHEPLEPVSKAIATLASGAKRTRVTKRNIWQVHDTILSLIISKNILYNPYGFEEVDQLHDEEFSATIMMTSTSHTLLNKRLVFRFHQQTILNVASILPSTLDVRNTLHNSSPIFDIAVIGSVDEMKLLLANRQGSLMDCDELGRSVLGYALGGSNAAMVKFLLENGADVDAYEYMLGLTEFFGPILCQNKMYSTKDSKRAQQRQRLNGMLCLKLMLEYGSDPTEDMRIEGGHYDSSALETLDNSSAEALGVLLDYGYPFIFPGGFLNKHETPLLHLASTHSLRNFISYCEIPDKIALLLQRGADVLSHDLDGNTCLHLVMRYRFDEECSTAPRYRNDSASEYHKELKDILMLLLTAGADVTARNSFEFSPSDVAWDYGHWQQWTDALQECGYDIDEVDVEREEESSCWASGTDIRVKTVRPKLMSFDEYLEIRKTRTSRLVEVSDSESDDDQDEFDDEDEDESDGKDGGLEDWETASGDWPDEAEAEDNEDEASYSICENQDEIDPGREIESSHAREKQDALKRKVE